VGFASQSDHQGDHLSLVDCRVVPANAIGRSTQHPANLASGHTTDKLGPRCFAEGAKLNTRLGGIVDELVLEHVEACVPSLVVSVAVVGVFVHESSILQIWGPWGLWWTVAQLSLEPGQSQNANQCVQVALIGSACLAIRLSNGSSGDGAGFVGDGDLCWPLGRLATQLSEAEVRGDPGPHHEGVEVDASVGADGPDVQVPHDVAGLSAGETGEALSQLIDRVGHAGEALGAGVGFVHESSIHRIGQLMGLW
jgi:hypothetical protein